MIALSEIRSSQTLQVNASNWSSLTVGSKQFFSPDSKILQLNSANLQAEFWHSTYTEFALVIIDSESQTIVCIRDHFGLEPLFYTRLANKFIFGSNLPDIISALGYTPELNQAQIMQMLLNTCVPAAYYSDETSYANIYRVEPGSILRIHQQSIHKSRYWDLNMQQDSYRYSNPQECLEQFSSLVSEGIILQLASSSNYACEFSGGLDSSTVVTGFGQLGIKPTLLMHIAPKDSDEIDDSHYAAKVIQHYELNDVHYVDATGFDLQQVIKQTSSLFAGTPQYLFPICANNIHQAMVNLNNNQSGNDSVPLLFSGFGGDECVSGHAPLALCLREYLANHDYIRAWQELQAYYVVNNLPQPNSIHLGLTIIRNLFPEIFSKILQWRKIATNSRKFTLNTIPRHFRSVNSVKEHELSLLKGTLSHHIRLRVEESAILAKAMGFRYQYPLLYPKLVAFCHNLPLEFKRKNGESRLMVRNYLAQYLPASVYQKHTKIGGIMPATIHKIKQEYTAGKYKQLFNNLPYATQSNCLQQQYSNNQQAPLLQQILLSGLKQYGEHTKPGGQ